MLKKVIRYSSTFILGIILGNTALYFFSGGDILRGSLMVIVVLAFIGYMWSVCS
jgi:hypothetical protein